MIITRAPFRISFFGGGTDLPEYFVDHGGAVISTTIDKYLYITCRKMPPFFEFKNRLAYGAKVETVDEIDEIEHPSIRETMRFLDITSGLDLHYNTDIPARSGIGSSSSFTVGLLQALYGLRGKMISKKHLANDAIHIERNLIGEAVGLQDQIAAAFGGLNHIAFDKIRAEHIGTLAEKEWTYRVNHILLGSERMKQLNDSLLLIFTGFQRFASDIEKSKINNISRIDHVLSEMDGITNEALSILTGEGGGDLSRFGKLMHTNWLLKKSLSDKVSTSRIDEIYETGMKNGALGGKILGAGGGGFILFFVNHQDKDRVLSSLKDLIHVPFVFDNAGSQVVYYKETD